MESQVTHMGRGLLSLAFRFHVSMMGMLGISADLMQWSESELALGAEQIALYKESGPSSRLGDQYRLLPAQGQFFTAVQYMSKDKDERHVVCLPAHPCAGTGTHAPIYLRGAGPNSRYAIDGFPEVHSGQAWMNLGLRLDLHDRQSTVRRITRIGLVAG